MRFDWDALHDASNHLIADEVTRRLAAGWDGSPAADEGRLD